MDVKVLAKKYQNGVGGGYEAGMTVRVFPFYLTLMIDHHVEKGRLLAAS